MKLLCIVVLTASILFVVVNSAQIDTSLNEQLNVYKAQIQVALSLLAKECGYERTFNDSSTSLEALRQLNQMLLSELFQCRSQQAETTTVPSNATVSQPQECQSATNYTESWRRDHAGLGIRPGGPYSYKGYACDLHLSSNWFRFAGAAGSQMLNTCPRLRSCGTLAAYWTDAPMPQSVGVETTVIVHAVGYESCKGWSGDLKVIRCSWNTDHDFIYKQTRDFGSSCQGAFCGME